MSKDIKNEELVASADSMSDNIRFNIYSGVSVAMETKKQTKNKQTNDLSM